MAIEVGGGLVAKLEQHKKNLASRSKRRAQKKLDKKLRTGAYAPPDGKVRAGYSAAYAEGWDRIFGKKAGNALQGAGAEVPSEPSADLRDEGAAGRDPR